MKIGISLFLLAFLVLSAHAEPRIELVTKLPALETYEGHLFHDRVLFVGRSRVKEGESHTVELYRSTGELLKSIVLPHSASYIHAYSAHKAIVVGRAANPYWHTYYTLIDTKGPHAIKTHAFPEEIQVDKFAGYEGNLFFVLLGENKILQQTAKKSVSLTPDISGPGYLDLAGDQLYVIENNNILYSGDENLVRIDLRSGKSQKVFSAYRNGLTRILAVEKGTRVAVSETGADQVLLIEAQSGKLAQSLPIAAGSPRGLAEYGKCLIVASEESRMLSVFRLDTAQEVAQYDLSVLGTVFRKARSVAVDPASGTLFARSTYLCSGCAETMSSVARVEAPELKALCNE